MSPWRRDADRELVEEMMRAPLLDLSDIYVKALERVAAENRRCTRQMLVCLGLVIGNMVLLGTLL